MYILGIETSCDETSAAVIRSGSVISNIIFSQIKVHKLYGGVVPEIAAREHLNRLPAVVDEALSEAGIGLKDIHAVASTYGPGLAGGLIVGISYGKFLSYTLKKKFIGINHLEAHLLSPFIENKDFGFPFIGLVVSGGHTNIYIAHGLGKYKLIASTRDDAAGEAFDKVAKMLGLPYPGGPAVSKAALKGDEKKIVFPQAQMKDASLDFSFSGLKTSVLYYLKNNKSRIESGEVNINDITAAFQKSIVRAVINKVKRVLKKYKIGKIAVTGGVAANGYLREGLEVLAAEKKLKVYFPSMKLCADNGAMIGYAGYLYAKDKKYSGMDVEAEPSLKL